MSSSRSSVPTGYSHTEGGRRAGTALLWAILAGLLALGALWGLDSMTREDLKAAEVLKYEGTARTLSEALMVAIVARTDAHPFAERFWLGPLGSGTTSLTFRRGDGPIAEPPGTAIPVSWDFEVTVEDRDAYRGRYRVHAQISIDTPRYTYGYSLTKSTTPAGDLPVRTLRYGIRVPEGLDHTTADSLIDALESSATGSTTQLSLLETDLSKSSACENVAIGPASQTTPPANLFGP
jgi:hypothetical protein